MLPPLFMHRLGAGAPSGLRGDYWLRVLWECCLKMAARDVTTQSQSLRGREIVGIGFSLPRSRLSKNGLQEIAIEVIKKFAK